MSQNKTVVPGMEGNGNSYGNNNSSTDFYSRNQHSRSTSKGTIVPGMEQANGASGAGAQSNYGGMMGGRPQKQSNKPVAGFLYSISRQGIGEYWPLYQGQNTIGSSPECDIRLQEGTVSGEHAVIVVRKMRNPEKTIASISDTRSTNGTMVNGESLGFSAMECFNGDILTIGLNYELVLMLIDVNALGLKVAENFVPIEDEQDFQSNNDMYNPEYTNNGAMNDMYPPQFNNSYNGYQGGYSADGTVGMDGGNNINSGGTIGM